MRARVPVPRPNQEFEEDLEDNFDNVDSEEEEEEELVDEEEFLDEEQVLEMVLELRLRERRRELSAINSKLIEKLKRDLEELRKQRREPEEVPSRGSQQETSVREELVDEEKVVDKEQRLEELKKDLEIIDKLIEERKRELGEIEDKE